MPYRTPGRVNTVIRRYELTSKETEEALIRWLIEVKGIPMCEEEPIQIQWKHGSQRVDGTVVPQISWDDNGYCG